MKRKRTPDDDSLASEPPRTEEDEALFRGNASQTLSTIIEEEERIDDDFDNVNMSLKIMVGQNNKTRFVIFFQVSTSTLKEKNSNNTKNKGHQSQEHENNQTRAESAEKVSIF